ncbi:MAG: hypothetical protein [Microvirus sp.]|nr:MAG: hypothetical protein [Microvirus sp.]
MRTLVQIIREMKLIESANLPASIKAHALNKLQREAEVTGGQLPDTDPRQSELPGAETGGTPPDPQAPKKSAKATP